MDRWREGRLALAGWLVSMFSLLLFLYMRYCKSFLHNVWTLPQQTHHLCMKSSWPLFMHVLSFLMHVLRHFTQKKTKSCVYNLSIIYASTISWWFVFFSLGSIWDAEDSSRSTVSQHETDPASLLGSLGLLEEVPTSGSHSWILWREDSTLLCMVGYDRTYI